MQTRGWLGSWAARIRTGAHMRTWCREGTPGLELPSCCTGPLLFVLSMTSGEEKKNYLRLGRDMHLDERRSVQFIGILVVFVCLLT